MKKVTTIIEDEVVYMTDPVIEFVSLVKHGANRTPFKILKSYKEGGLVMSKESKKIIQAVIIKKDLEEDQKKILLEGFKVDACTKFLAYESYTQCDINLIDPQSINIEGKEDENKVVTYYILGVPTEKAEGIPENLKPGTIEGKEVTLDDLYSELYAMADIVSGAMRQSNTDSGFKSSTILMAIDNFKAFAEVVFSGNADKQAVKQEDHPTLAFPLVGIKEVETPPTDTAVDVATIEEVPDTKLVEIEAINTLKSLVESLKSQLDKYNESLKENTTIVKGLKEDVEKIKKTPKSSKSISEIIPPSDRTEKNGVFTGLFLCKHK